MTDKKNPPNSIQLSRAKSSDFERVTVPSVLSKKGDGKKLSALTAYDFTMAQLFDAAGIDIILVGDSVGSVVQGLETTIPVTLEEMIYHSRCVTRGVTRALVVGDLPFLSYQVSISSAIEASGRLLKEGGVSAVKLEGGLPMVKTIEALTSIDIPVMGHVGLTPQSVHRMGGHKVQGRVRNSSKKLSAGTWDRVLEDAKAVESAGAFAVVIEGVPAELAEEITQTIAIPTIGIGAGNACDGQILVCYDMLGMTEKEPPRFVKKFADLRSTIKAAVEEYREEINKGEFPSKENTFFVPESAKSITKVK